MLRMTASTLLLATLLGCGSPDSGRVPVAGNVTVNGESVEYGAISFRPTHDSRGPAAGTDIVDGAYAISGDAGPVVGSYLAHITIVEPSTNQKFLKNPGKMTAFEVPVEITSGQTAYDFSVPLARR